jgi:hypothetical protein
MNCEWVQDLLYRSASGALTPELRREIDGHLASCDGCRAEAERMGPVLAGAARLPRSIEPPADLWPSIAEQIGRHKLVEGRFTSPVARPWWTRPSILAAAALVLIVLSSTVTTLVVRGPGGFPPAPVQRVALSGEFLTLEAQYVRAADEILGALNQGEVKIAPGTRAILERNLRVIDQAIAESREALARDPANVELKGMLLSTYEQKLDLLRRVAST